MNKGVTLLRELQSSVSLLIEEADISFDDLKCNSRFLVHLFDKIPDYRSRCLVDYSLSSLLVISLVLIMKGEFKSFHYASHYVEVYKSDFAKMGLIKDGKVPSHDTFRRMFMLVDAREIKKAIVNNLDKLLKAILDNYNLGRGKELVSIDGKGFRGSGRSIGSSTPLRNRNVLNVYNASKEICMFSSPLDDKESEIALVKKKWTHAERLLVTPPIYSVQWLEVLASSIVPCIGQELGNRVQTTASPC